MVTAQSRAHATAPQSHPPGKPLYQTTKGRQWQEFKISSRKWSASHRPPALLRVLFSFWDLLCATLPFGVLASEVLDILNWDIST